ncbi:hypothetical protein CEUSTIGMA_g6634.t1 [Chlamydomonas eustigma]|uniref:Uncharacterized protein n=1 Tax=Chlamydomonas eustigma TaxID=1157962 RepID=A0A250X7Y5_9CHLO|nr:hypothetical protein CEUSTIGMA_g6634.t1 [Chlamydomonas eustigma]|eukprot:GAX79194.1 hypothetical protein CEUSTIGMA_g6634.t1 [Chlamydomonas eustigma]
MYPKIENGCLKACPSVLPRTFLPKAQQIPPVFNNLKGKFSTLKQIQPTKRHSVVLSAKNDVVGSNNSTGNLIASSSASARRAVLKGYKTGVQPIQELSVGSLADYMSLPASQYSVLDARKIERINDEMFRCYVGELQMFSWSVEPVLTVSVTVEPEAGGCTIRLLSCKLKGSKFVEEINNKFSAQMTNEVRWRDASPGATSLIKEIVSTTILNVDLEVPSWCSFIQTSSIEQVGCSVLQKVLDVMVPRFLTQLGDDYKAWVKGEARTPANSSS